jgi:actin-like ATPase involved in cell morphogenesis
MSYQLGIDLGTTYSAAAVCRPVGEHWVAPEMVALSGHRTDVPSVLFVGPDGEVLVGDAAERRAVTDPDRVVREFKRRVGDPTPIVVGGRTWAPEELCARLVRWIVDQVADREGGPAERIAVTHPASWGGHKLERMAEALDEQGLTVTFLAEPQAAALHYAAGERVAAGSTIAVYDLGGGTFDAAVVRKTDRSHFALQGRPEGIERLGGVDFDQVVFDHVVAGLPAAFEELDDADPAVLTAVARLRRECTEAKEALSADTEAAIPVLLPGQRGSVRMHRSEFEDAIRDRVGETVEALRRAVASAGLEPDGLDAVLLVGGSSRVPLVGQLVSQELGRPVAVDTDPKNAIAKGAALAMSPRPMASWPAVALAPIPGGPETPTDGLRLTHATAGSLPALIGATVEIGPSRPVGSSGGWPAADPPGAVRSTGGLPPVGPPPRPGLPATNPDWDYDAEPEGRRRMSAGVLVGLGGALAAAGVVAAAVFWPSAAPAASSGVGGMDVPISSVPADPTATSPTPDPTTADRAPIERGGQSLGGSTAATTGRATTAPAAGGARTPSGRGAAPGAPVAPAAPAVPAAPAAPVVPVSSAAPVASAPGSSAPGPSDSTGPANPGPSTGGPSGSSGGAPAGSGNSGGSGGGGGAESGSTGGGGSGSTGGAGASTPPVADGAPTGTAAPASPAA